MTSPSSANTTADRKAVRVRNSIARSLRAISQAAESTSATGERLAVKRAVGGGVDAVAAVVANEPPAAHHGCGRRQRQSLSQVMRHDDDRCTCRKQLAKERG